MTDVGYDAFDDPYCYKGTGTLRNKAGLRDAEALEAFELEMTSLRAEEPLPDGRFGPAHYRAVHRHLFQDVYAWAGAALEMNSAVRAGPRPGRVVAAAAGIAPDHPLAGHRSAGPIFIVRLGVAAAAVPGLGGGAPRVAGHRFFPSLFTASRP